jgi:hypothetical protein
MKKPLGVWVTPVAIAVATAVLGLPTSATAETSLCESAASPCGSAEIYPAGTALKASLKEGTKALLATNLLNVECTSASLEGKTSAASAEPLPLEISSLSFGGCKTGSTGCEVKATTLPSATSISLTSPPNGKLFLKGGEVSFICGKLINCTYFTNSLEAQGGNPALLVAKEVELAKVGGFLCPLVSKWSATYSVSSPTPVYVEE